MRRAVSGALAALRAGVSFAVAGEAVATTDPAAPAGGRTVTLLTGDRVRLLDGEAFAGSPSSTGAPVGISPW